jgi:hypothetical protein
MERAFQELYVTAFYVDEHGILTFTMHIFRLFIFLTAIYALWSLFDSECPISQQAFEIDKVTCTMPLREKGGGPLGPWELGLQINLTDSLSPPFHPRKDQALPLLALVCCETLHPRFVSCRQLSAAVVSATWSFTADAAS